MWLRALRNFLKGGHVLGRALTLATVYPTTRGQWLYAALSTDLLTTLRVPRTREELIGELGVVRPDLLDALLAEGVAWRELAVKDGRFRLRGKRSRALVTDVGDAYAAQLRECFWYHGSAYIELGDRLRGAALGDYLEQTGDLVARSSRTIEPPTAAFLHRCISRVHPSPSSMSARVRGCTCGMRRDPFRTSQGSASRCRQPQQTSAG